MNEKIVFPFYASHEVYFPTTDQYEKIERKKAAMRHNNCIENKTGPIIQIVNSFFRPDQCVILAASYQSFVMESTQPYLCKINPQGTFLRRDNFVAKMILQFCFKLSTIMSDDRQSTHLKRRKSQGFYFMLCTFLFLQYVIVVAFFISDKLSPRISSNL